jgi:hypothetical protein
MNYPNYSGNGPARLHPRSCMSAHWVLNGRVRT